MLAASYFIGSVRGESCAGPSGRTSAAARGALARSTTRESGTAEMHKTRCFAAMLAPLGIALLGCLASTGCEDQSTGTSVVKPAAAAAGEKASMEHMRANMGKGGMTKK
jgi:hypothetical protein